MSELSEKQKDVMIALAFSYNDAVKKIESLSNQLKTANSGIDECIQTLSSDGDLTRMGTIKGRIKWYSKRDDLLKKLLEMRK